MGLGSGILGAIIGGICAGPLGAIIGGGIGAYCFNNNSSSPATSADDISGSPVDNPIMPPLFRCLGKLAKSDGQVSETEAAFIKELMKSWQLPEATRRALGVEFNAGRDSTESFKNLVGQLATELRRYDLFYKLNIPILQTFCALVAIDRNVDANEKILLQEAGEILQAPAVISSFFQDQYADSYRYEQSRQNQSNNNQSAGSLDECYKLLGVDKNATDQEVKKAYRKKAAEFHPDKVQGTGLSAAFIQFAKEQFQEISNAYERICQSRNMK